MKVYYCDHVGFPLPDGHLFPAQKYALLREAVIRTKLVDVQDLLVPQPATDEQILRAHEADYLQKLREGRLTPKEVRRIGLPWSPQLLKRARCSVGGTIEACYTALGERIAVNLGGGTHHAFRDHGQGYCLLNDVVIAARAMQAEGRARRVLVLDCDVHQGNGTAALTASDPTIFTFSIHSHSNFPLRKVSSDLDIALEDGTDDTQYLAALREGLERSLALAEADLAIYLAGADPHRRDRLGHLALTKAGLAERDRFVFDSLCQAGLPVAAVLAGGYGHRVQDTVDIHLNTVCNAVQAYESTYK